MKIYIQLHQMFLKKKIRVLDEQIKNGSIDLANSAIEKAKAKSKAQQMAEEKEKDWMI